MECLVRSYASWHYNAMLSHNTILLQCDKERSSYYSFTSQAPETFDVCCVVHGLHCLMQFDAFPLVYRTIHCHYVLLIIKHSMLRDHNHCSEYCRTRTCWHCIVVWSTRDCAIDAVPSALMRSEFSELFGSECWKRVVRKGGSLQKTLETTKTTETKR